MNIKSLTIILFALIASNAIKCADDSCCEKLANLKTALQNFNLANNNLLRNVNNVSDLIARHQVDTDTQAQVGQLKRSWIDYESAGSALKDASNIDMISRNLAVTVKGIISAFAELE